MSPAISNKSRLVRHFRVEVHLREFATAKLLQQFRDLKLAVFEVGGVTAPYQLLMNTIGLAEWQLIRDRVVQGRYEVLADPDEIVSIDPAVSLMLEISCRDLEKVRNGR